MEGTRIIIDFSTENQAKTFYEWFMKYGFDDLIENDHVHDDLMQDEFYTCISSNELPGAMSDKNAYWIEIE